MRTEWSGVLQQEDTGSNNSEVMRGEDGVEWSGVLQQEDTGSDNSEVMQGEDGVEWSTPAGGHRQ